MQEQDSSTPVFTNYLIVILSIMVVNPFFATVTTFYLLIFLAFLFILALTRYVDYYDSRILIILGIVYVLIAVQAILFKGISYAAVYLPLIIFYIPFLIYKLLDISYFSYFVKVMFAIAIITTPFWFLQSFFHPFDQLMSSAIEWAYPLGWGSVPRSLLIYTAAWDPRLFNEGLGIYRNSGLFHEPGAYGVFLSIAIIVNTLMTGRIFENKNKVFIFCLLTTLSTTAFIVIFIFFGAILFKSNFNFLMKAIILSVFIWFSYQTYTNEDFLQSKINTQFEEQTSAADANKGIYTGQSGRFYAFFTSLNNFMQNPLSGRGIIYATSEKATGEMNEGSSYTYGFVGMLATYGILFVILYLINLFRGLKIIGSLSGQSKVIIAAGFLAINLALLTQVFVTSIVVVFIFVIGVYANKSEANDDELLIQYES